MASVWVLNHWDDSAYRDYAVGVTADETIAKAWEGLPDHSTQEFELGETPSCGCRVEALNPQPPVEQTRYFIGSWDNQVSKEVFDKAVSNG